MVVIDFETFLPPGNSTSADSAAVVSPAGGVTRNATRASSPFLSKLTGVETGSILNPGGAVRRTVAAVAAAKFCKATVTVFGCVSGKTTTFDSRLAVTSGTTSTGRVCSPRIGSTQRYTAGTMKMMV